MIRIIQGKHKDLKTNTSGFLMVEAIFTIVLVFVVLAILSASFLNVRLIKKNNSNALAYAFLQTQMEVLKSYPYVSLTNRIDGDFIGFAYNHGSQSVEPSGGALSSPNLVSVVPATNELANNVSSTVLLEHGFLEDFEFLFDINVDPSAEVGWQAGMIFRYQDPENYYLVSIEDGEFGLIKVVGGVSTELFSDITSHQKNIWYNIKVIATADSFELFSDGSSVATVVDDTFTSGFVGMAGKWVTPYYIDDVALNTTSFNGTWNFDSESIGDWPDGFVQVAPAELDDYTAKLTIADYGGRLTTKQITATVEWTEKSELKSATISTLITEPFYEE